MQGQQPTRLLIHVCRYPSYVYNGLLADLAACRHVIEVKILTELRAMLSKETSFRMFLTLVETRQLKIHDEVLDDDDDDWK